MFLREGCYTVQENHWESTKGETDGIKMEYLYSGRRYGGACISFNPLLGFLYETVRDGNRSGVPFVFRMYHGLCSEYFNVFF